MNRVMVYPGAIPLETDLLNAQKNDMIGLAKLSAAVLGTSTQVNGLACTPNSPAALNVIVAPGDIYSLQNIDGTAYSSLAADTAHQIVKQGILLDQVILSTPAPGTAGQSINYLIQATYSDVDGTPVVLPYYNASNPSTAFSGPANAGTTNNTVRAGVCTVSVKTGVSAATGSQVTPAPDAGNVGLYVVTVANGQTTVTAPNIATAANAPFISSLSAYITQIAGDARYLKLVGQALLTATGNIPASAIGGTVLISSASALTGTLPLANSGRKGDRLTLFNVGAGAGTIARNGSDSIVVNNTSVTSLVESNGDTLILETDGVSTWYAVSGSAQLPYSTSVPGKIVATAFSNTRAVMGAAGTDTTVFTLSFTLDKPTRLVMDARLWFGSTTATSNFGYLRFVLDAVIKSRTARQHFGVSAAGFVYTAQSGGSIDLGVVAAGSHTLTAIWNTDAASGVTPPAFNPGPADTAGWAQADSEIIVRVAA